MSWPKERPQFEDEYEERQVRQDSRRFPEIIEERIDEWASRAERSFAMQVREADFRVQYMRSDLVGNPASFVVRPNDGQFYFEFKRVGGLGIQRSIVEGDPFNQASGIRVLSSRMIPAEHMEKLNWVMVMPGLLTDKGDYDSVIAINPHEQAILQNRNLQTPAAEDKAAA